MSSAILYLAIIAIWACVLIPRWLRRDSARASSHTSSAPVSDDVGAHEDVSGWEVPAALDPETAGVVVAAADDGADPAAADVSADPAAPEQESAPPPLTHEESRRRMMAARRRLLGMLTVLEVGAIGLAMMGFAALWVVIPPTVMFCGYLLLLREAAHADAEQARREQEAAWARARARERERARAATVPDAPDAPGALGVPGAPGAPVVSPRHAVGFDDSGPGRDFAPGLAGKYTTSTGEVVPVSEQVGEDYYDQYTQRRLRAVGD